MDRRLWELLATSSRWRRHVSFVAKWFERPLSPEDGLAPGAVASYESKLGIQLPESVREWYCLLGARLELVNGAHSASRLESLGIDADESLPEGSVLLAWAQGMDWAWTVRDRHAPDPIVVLHEPYGSTKAPTYTASDFYLALMVQQVAVLSRADEPPAGLKREVRWGIADQSGPLRARVEDLYAPLPPIWLSGVSYGDADSIVVMDGETAHVCTRTAEAWAKASALDLELYSSMS